MREAEPARITKLEYRMSDESQEETWALVELEMVDPGSPVDGKKFEVEIPSSSAGYAEFVIHLSRFNASVQRSWHVGDRCQV